MSFLHLNNHPPIKYGVDPAPVPLNGDAAVDNIQDLLRRKRELEKNKSKFRLSEADCNLLLTNANEYYFKDKQVVVHEGQELPSVYRLKSGNLNIVKNGKIVSSISQGWFLGETIFLNGRSCVYDATLIADGPVTMCELNFEFVSKLFEVDYVLALKFYRTLSSKLAAVCYALMGHLLGSCFESISKSQSPLLYFNNNFPVPSSFSPTRNTPSHSVSSDSSDSPDSSSSSSIARSRSSTFIPTASITAIATPAKSRMVVNAAKLSQCPNLPDSFLLEAVNRRKRLSKSKSMSNLHLPFKVYSLETNSKGLLGCKLKRTKICIVSEPFGFKNKVSIEYTKIKNIVRTTEKSITIIYNNFQAKTLFFKSKEDAEEFSGLSLQLVEATTHEIRKSTSGSPISSPTLAISGRTVSFSGEFPPFLDNDLNSSDSKISSGSDEASSSNNSNNSNNLKNSRNSFSDSHQDEDLTTNLMSLSTTEELRKGDFLLREGDLFQRIYTIVSGTFVAMVNGHALKEMGPGEVMGIPSLLHLRPCPVSIRVDSETASVRVLPAYKINEVANANLQLSSRLYKRAATTLQTQIEEILMKYQALTIDVGSYGDNSNNYNNNKDTSPVSSPPTTPKQKGPVSPRAAVVQQP